MLKVVRLNCSLIRKLSTVRANNEDLQEKLDALKLNQFALNKATRHRLDKCSNDFVRNLATNLALFEIKDKHLTYVLNNHENWSQLTRDSLQRTCETFRDLKFTPNVYIELITRNPLLIDIELKPLITRLNELKDFFTKRHLNKLFVKTPTILTDDFDSFRYKFTYIFALMKISQDEMVKTNTFSKSIDHIRSRHLFLSRSGFYDKPNKKGITKIDNPKLSSIMDTSLSDFLKICTFSTFNEIDYESFCEYLNEENFDDELLGNNIGNLLEKQIITSIRQAKRDEKLADQEEY